MILYQLRCGAGHEFEGWFRSSDAFDEQAAGGLLTCPFCGTIGVERAVMAPAIRSSRNAAAKSTAQAAPSASVAGTPALPDALRAVLQRIRAEVERNCENLGDRFAEEAIRMHRGDVEERGIYGSTTESDREALEEAGVEVVAIPWLRSADG
ncbi:DUF1178 family protein [Acetobacteraceae bacterium KSS8]|uniref:DUF1178 family protein n=1 Tax=Endosaccharibacter trunci TaxID=2812733 RepID=A0ABT1W4N3_9PROT|nr:DUF1178 family protein [Acetobacteraceae bacterium KSS8]